MHLPTVPSIFTDWKMFHLKTDLHFFANEFYIQTFNFPDLDPDPGISLSAWKKAEEIIYFNQSLTWRVWGITLVSSGGAPIFGLVDPDIRSSASSSTC